MNENSSNPKATRVSRWLAAAGITVCLAIPLSANADYQNNGAIEVLVSAAVAYAVIDAAGGFDDKHHKRHYGHTGYRSDRYRYQRHLQYDRRHWARDQYRYKKHAHKHQLRALKRDSRSRHQRHDAPRYRRAYH